MVIKFFRKFKVKKLKEELSEMEFMVRKWYFTEARRKAYQSEVDRLKKEIEKYGK